MLLELVPVEDFELLFLLLGVADLDRLRACTAHWTRHASTGEGRSHSSEPLDLSVLHARGALDLRPGHGPSLRGAGPTRAPANLGLNYFINRITSTTTIITAATTTITTTATTTITTYSYYYYLLLLLL